MRCFTSMPIIRAATVRERVLSDDGAKRTRSLTVAARFMQDAQRKKLHQQRGSALCRGLDGEVRRLPSTFGRFDYKTHANRLGGDLDPAHRAVHDCPHALNVGLELAFRHAGGLETNAAEVFSLTPPGDRPSSPRFSTGKKANTRHIAPDASENQRKQVVPRTPRTRHRTPIAQFRQADRRSAITGVRDTFGGMIASTIAR